MTSDLFGSSVGSKKVAPRCHTTHKPLKFGKGTLLGASCSSPRKGYDIYIGFDYGMTFNHQKWPWEESEDSVIELQYRITDMCAPKSPKDFKNMVNWIVEQLKAGKKIHMGCIGGHGRTGLVIAAIKNVWDGEKDATTWTRKNHCEKAVESKSQINFLHKHFGIKKVKPTKDFGNYKGTQTGRISGKAHNKSNVAQIDRKLPNTGERLSFVAGKGSIWS